LAAALKTKKNMQKRFEKNIQNVISTSAKLLQPKRKRRTVVAKDGESAAKRRFAKLKETIGVRGKIGKESGRGRQKTLKFWEQSFGGGFCTSMKQTADFLKEKQLKAKEKKEKRRLRRYSI